MHLPFAETRRTVLFGCWMGFAVGAAVVCVRFDRNQCQKGGMQLMLGRGTGCDQMDVREGELMMSLLSLSVCVCLFDAGAHSCHVCAAACRSWGPMPDTALSVSRWRFTLCVCCLSCSLSKHAATSFELLSVSFSRADVLCVGVTSFATAHPHW